MSEEDIEFEWIPDTTGRFRHRPWYTQAYLDERCEQLLFEFLTQLYGQITVPVPTGALIKLIERRPGAQPLRRSDQGRGRSVGRDLF